MHILKRVLLLALIALTMTTVQSAKAFGESWNTRQTVEVITEKESLNVYSKPTLKSKVAFELYPGMRLKPEGFDINKEGVWMRFEAGNRDYWTRWIEGGKQNLIAVKSTPSKIIDSYGILEKPHSHAVKLVKYKGAKGRLETYRKIGNKYILKHWYPVTYPKSGPKSLYGDLKTIGGPIVRYMYRTTRSSMNGHNKNGEKFGVYKVSFPMPHDALPHFLEGKMGPSGYNKMPVLNEKNGVFFPHPHSLMGADILIHTDRKGSLGCINVENEAMSFLYQKDLSTTNDREIIPMIIYDEDRLAPPVGNLF